ncbi:serine/threonine protein kinase [Haliangium ochraceum]|uniref:Serine/threonine protein kinase n=1 Tax=Haliangium ochraceum (strain DSM 14365 / JCM 11303 / SMP-2) TaxID=502025 RepID=D0LY97_HALO1|nr:serine/threonine-protein kinase [Haliangium ochraceum]ACY16247.1 serine/threonine protein kinase [Haliangium ochraceum DSM 14365]
MSIAVGQRVDKYEVAEQVGQGGMAVVYRGVDRSLERVVAIKVLHQHLAGHEEARARFAREARAVAKLRHENILEIYDFADDDARDSYIVTEFIDGPTLTESLADHLPRYPEIGAMVMTQVCRALAHAHSLGILHRDVKPENIMIRTDGVVKLTDFGIAQMLDAQRMTVTGQLLGSPAYMSPEHIEGQPLDFRTDIFAAGVVLYQLVVGELPFTGRNPHELLKRISDGVYRDPRQANPLVGNELGRIIDTALARAKEDRYRDITEMLSALERYLKHSGIDEPRQELSRYFDAPVAYELALRERLLAALVQRGRELAGSERVAALDVFNRALTIDPDNADVLAQVHALSRRQRTRRMLALFGGVLAAAALLLGAVQVLREAPAPEPARVLPPAQVGPATEPAAGSELPALAGDSAIAAVPADAGMDASAASASTSPGLGSQSPPQRPGSRRPGVGREQSPDAAPRRDPPVASAPPGPATRAFTLNVSPLKSEYRVDDGPWLPIARSRATLELDRGSHVVEVRNTACCESDQQIIAADAPGGVLDFTLGYLPAMIVPKCPVVAVGVQVDGQPARLDRKHPIFFTRSLGQRAVVITFFSDDGTDEHTVQVQYNETKVVTCAFP